MSSSSHLNQSMSKGRESVSEVLRLFLACAPSVEKMGADVEETLRTKGLPKQTGGVAPWAHLYELPFLHHLISAVRIVGVTSDLEAVSKSETPNLALLRSVMAIC